MGRIAVYENVQGFYWALENRERNRKKNKDVVVN
jgi:hypothetical protein